MWSALPSAILATVAQGLSLIALIALMLVVCPQPAIAQGDYDPRNDDWNGLSSFVGQARSLGIDLEIRNDLDYAVIDNRTSLIFVYPTVDLERSAVVAHLRGGGRILIADDFGASAPLLERLGVGRDDSPVEGGLHFRGEPHLPIAAPVTDDHVLTQGVRRLMTNHPATLVTDLPSVFVTGEPARTLVAVGAIGEGRLVIVGDPSSLINNMLEVQGNQQFARNLLRYLSGDDGRRLLLVTGRFGQQAGGAGVNGTVSQARRELNIRLARLSDGLAALPNRDGPPRWLLALATIGSIALLGVIIFQLKPRPRLYSGRWLRPLAEERSAGFVGTLEYFKHPKATHLYPLMILKRIFEERLLDGLDLPAPARLKSVVEAYSKVESNEGRRRELDRLLVRLSTLAASATAGDSSSLRVSARELRRTYEQARRLLKPVGRDIEVP